MPSNFQTFDNNRCFRSQKLLRMTVGWTCQIDYHKKGGEDISSTCRVGIVTAGHGSIENSKLTEDSTQKETIAPFIDSLTSLLTMNLFLIAFLLTPICLAPVFAQASGSSSKKSLKSTYQSEYFVRMILNEGKELPDMDLKCTKDDVKLIDKIMSDAYEEEHQGGRYLEESTPRLLESVKVLMYCARQCANFPPFQCWTIGADCQSNIKLWEDYIENDRFLRGGDEKKESLSFPKNGRTIEKSSLDDTLQDIREIEKTIEGYEHDVDKLEENIFKNMDKLEASNQKIDEIEIEMEETDERDKLKTLRDEKKSHQNDVKVYEKENEDWYKEINGIQTNHLNRLYEDLENAIEKRDLQVSKMSRQRLRQCNRAAKRIERAIKHELKKEQTIDSDSKQKLSEGCQKLFHENISTECIKNEP